MLYLAYRNDLKTLCNLIHSHHTEEGLFETLNSKFKPQYMLLKQANENTEEWMGRIRDGAMECNYKELDR